MSIDRAAIAELIGQLANVQCVWATDPQPMLGMDGRKRAWIKLTLTQYDAVGNDDYRQQPNANNPEILDSVIVGYRKFIVSMRARSLETDLQAYDLLERVRWGLGTATTRAVLQRTKTAIVTFSTIVTYAGSANNNHATLDANFDVTFAGLGGGVPKDDTGQTIGTINGGTGIPITLKK